MFQNMRAAIQSGLERIKEEIKDFGLDIAA